MDWRYWLELPLVVGLWGRLVADICAGAMASEWMAERDSLPDPQDFDAVGMRLQPAPVAGPQNVPKSGYAFYGVSAMYWAMVFQAGFMNTIATPGPIFGALGVPAVVMEWVAYANILVLYYYGGAYLATWAKAMWPRVSVDRMILWARGA